MTSAPATAFGRAHAYDAHARVQGEVADWLAERLRALPRPARVLEIGCGTGFVRAAAGGIADDWLLTDIAPAMLDRARARLAHAPDVRFAVLDCEHPVLDEPPFDLVTGSLVVQWFDDLAGGLDRLFGHVAAGGRLIVTTLAAGSFAEWRAAHDAEGLAAGTRAYPDREALAALRCDGIAPEIEMRRFVDRHADGRAFARALKAIGAATPRDGHRPLGPAAWRRVLRRWEANGASICYDVAMLTFARAAR